MKIKASEYSQGEIMRIVREWSGKSQREFGAEIGKSERTIQGYEAGTINVTLKTILKIAETYGIDIIIEK